MRRSSTSVWPHSRAVRSASLAAARQQRLARALVQDAELYFADEPFQGVDATTELAIVELPSCARRGRRSSPSITTCRRCPSTSTRWRSTCAGSRAARSRRCSPRRTRLTYGGRAFFGRNGADLFDDYTLRTVALGSAALGLTSGALGTFAVLRRQSLLGDAISHAALPGVALAFLLTSSKALPPSRAPRSPASSAPRGDGCFVRTTRIKYDAALGIVLSVFFGFGLVLLTFIQRRPTPARRARPVPVRAGGGPASARSRHDGDPGRDRARRDAARLEGAEAARVRSGLRRQSRLPDPRPRRPAHLAARRRDRDRPADGRRRFDGSDADRARCGGAAVGPTGSGSGLAGGALRRPGRGARLRPLIRDRAAADGADDRPLRDRHRPRPRSPRRRARAALARAPRRDRRRLRLAACSPTCTARAPASGRRARPLRGGALGHVRRHAALAARAGAPRAGAETRGGRVLTDAG